MMVKNGDNLYACDFCDKIYDKKPSFQAHMRAKHPIIKKKNQEDNVTEKEPINESIVIVNMEEAESEANAKPTEDEEDPAFHDCIELEEGDLLGFEEYERLQPLVSSAELESFLPQDDSLLNEFLVVEQVALEQEFGDLFKSRGHGKTLT